MWTLGIDPGLRETGLCLLNAAGVVQAAATIKAEGPQQADLVRYHRLAAGVVRWLHRQGSLFGLDSILVGIEYPVVKGKEGRFNVVNYRKQCSTILAMELALARSGITMFVEINPMEAKVALTGHGDADKADMILHSPWVGNTGPSIEAMADAYGVAMAAREKSGNVRALPDIDRLAPYSTYTEE